MLLDIIIGLLIGWGIGALTGEPSLTLVLFGAFAAIVPDIDFIIWLARHGWKTDQYVHEHRDILHHPFLFSVLGGALIALIAPVFGLVWFVATLWHFVHDTYDGGWGIRWGSPFSRSYYTLASHSPVRHIRDKEAQRALAASGNADWSGEYLRPNRKIIFMYVVSALVIAAILWLTFGR